MFERIRRPQGNRGRYARGKVSTSYPILLLGVCDDKDDCYKKTDELCEQAGHDGAEKKSVELTEHADGGSTCSADCLANGAVAFVTCKPKRQ